MGFVVCEFNHTEVYKQIFLFNTCGNLGDLESSGKNSQKEQKFQIKEYNILNLLQVDKFLKFY